LFCTGSPRTVEDPVTHLPVSTYDLNCSAKGSSDPEGAALSYLISWGDGSAQEASTDGSFYHSYSIINSAFSVTLSVSDGVNTTEKTVNYQTLPSDTNLPPIAKLSCSESQTSSGTTVTFTTHCDATGSSDPEGRALTYQLNWGDNQTDMSTTGRFSHTYSVGGAYNITLLVRDGVKGTYKTLNWRATAPIR
jgi:PKD domain